MLKILFSCADRITCREDSEEKKPSYQEKNRPMTPIDSSSVAVDKVNMTAARASSIEKQDASILLMTSDRLRIHIYIFGLNL